MSRKILVTAALPYANGDIHLGHMLEYLQTDFWVRFQKMRGHECLYICADDTHGTPIMIAAHQKGISPEALIHKAAQDHLRDFAAFGVEFDHFGSTHSPENEKFAGDIFKKMEQGGHIDTRNVRQAYCEKDGMFLPDRFVRGTCPKCGADDQYGDSCDNCSATYAPTDLKNPKCSVCGTPPVEKDSEHLFVRLADFQSFLSQWVPEHTQPEIANKLQEWLGGTLRDWDISRDAPYFGFEIPGHPGKFFYVWLDAPIGYLSATAQWAKKNGRQVEEFWNDDKAEIYHFIGKDIVYFHTLFWPAMLKAAGYRLPNHVFVHGFLKVNGEKMSKSKGTFINASTYLKHTDPRYLRYYYACKLSGSVDDVDLSLTDFVNRVNSDLVGKITNVASRGFQMLHRSLEGKLGQVSHPLLVKSAQQRSEAIAKHYENREFSKVVREVREIADEANRFFDENEPWKKVKEDPEAVRGILTTILNQFRLCALYLKPILPSYTAKVEKLFQEAPYNWETAGKQIENQDLLPYTHLIQRIDPKDLEKMVDDSKGPAKAATAPVATAVEGVIQIGDFSKVDLRVARIETAESVEGADKLLKLTVDVGGPKKTVFAGIKKTYAPEDLVGKLVILVNNLQPRQMKFGLSEGMILAASDKDTLRVLTVDSGAKAGMKVS